MKKPIEIVSWEDLTPEQQESLINWYVGFAELLMDSIIKFAEWFVDVLGLLLEEKEN